MSGKSIEQERLEFEKVSRAKEIDLERRKVELEELSFNLAQIKSKENSWRSPLVVAILAATVAALGNGVVAVVNGSLERALEDRKSEQARILEMIKTGNPDKAAENLEFLLETGLLTDPQLHFNISTYLKNRKPGTGAALATSSQTMGGIVGIDDRLKVKDTTQVPFNSICLIRNSRWLATGVVIAPNVVVTANLPDQFNLGSVEISCGANGEVQPFGSVAPVGFVQKIVQVQNPKSMDARLTFLQLPTGSEQPKGAFSVRDVETLSSNIESIKIAGYPGDFGGTMSISTGSLLGFDETTIFHDLDTGGGVGGAPVFVRVNGAFVLFGIHIGTGQRKIAVRVTKRLFSEAIEKLKSQ